MQLPGRPPSNPLADTSATAASLAATLAPTREGAAGPRVRLHRHLSAGGNGSGNGSDGSMSAAEEGIFEDMGDIGLKPATVYHNLR